MFVLSYKFRVLVFLLISIAQPEIELELRRAQPCMSGTWIITFNKIKISFQYFKKNMFVFLNFLAEVYFKDQNRIFGSQMVETEI